MAARFRHLPARTAYGPYDVDDERFEDEELWPGERVAPPPSRSRGGAILRRLILILVAAAGGWAVLSNQATLPDWQSVETAVTSLKSHIAARLAESAKSAAAPARIEPLAKAPAPELPPIVELPVSSRDPISPGATALEAPPLTTGSLPPAAAQPLPPPTPDPADPLQMRASAVGLHPDLSRVVLERLSATDYRNAGIAIETALKETPDSGVYVWPRQRKPELALFTVRFVAGAAAGCRRYVVTVTKDGWLTTAPPMEVCGQKPRQAKRG